MMYLYPEKPKAVLAPSGAFGYLKSPPMRHMEQKLRRSPNGLTTVEAKKGLPQYGPNAIVEKKTNLFLKSFRHFWGSIPWMLNRARRFSQSSSSRTEGLL